MFDLRYLGLAVLALSLSACSGEDAEEPASLPGTWNGSFEGVNVNGPMSVTFMESTGTGEYPGSVDLSGDDCLMPGPITATLSGSQLSFRLRVEGTLPGSTFLAVNTLNVTGTAEGTSFNGSFTLRGDSCPDDDGTVTLAKAD